MSHEQYTKEWFLEHVSSSLNSAKEIIPIVLDLIQPKSVVDIGCGMATFLSVFKDHGVSDIIGIDGDYVDRKSLMIPDNLFYPMDINQPIQLKRKFDLAMSLEVGEHLEDKSAERFIQSIVELAPVVLFSAALPHQGGTNHVNEQWPEYWASIFRKYDYVPVDCIRKRVWANENVAFWYAQNSLIYAHKDYLDKNIKLKKEYDQTNASQLSLVHPKQQLLMWHRIKSASDPRWTPFNDLIKALPAALMIAMKWKVSQFQLKLHKRFKNAQSQHCDTHI